MSQPHPLAPLSTRVARGAAPRGRGGLKGASPGWPPPPHFTPPRRRAFPRATAAAAAASTQAPPGHVSQSGPGRGRSRGRSRGVRVAAAVPLPLREGPPPPLSLVQPRSLSVWLQLESRGPFRSAGGESLLGAASRVKESSAPPVLGLAWAGRRQVGRGGRRGFMCYSS